MKLSDLAFWRHRGKSMKEAGGGTSGQITQANIKNFVVKAVGNINDTSNGDFAAPEYDLSEIKDAISTDSYIKAAISKYSQLIFKAGYNIVGQNDAAAEYIRSRLRIMSFMTSKPFDIMMQEVAYDLVAYANAFLVKSRVDMTNIGGLQAKGVMDIKPVGGYFRVDPTSMQIKRDKTGTIKSYQQVVGNNKKTYKPTDVVHFYMDKDGGAAFGTPRIVAALEDVKILRKIEGNVVSLVYRYALPIIQMKVGLPQSGFMATDQEIKDAKNEVDKLSGDGVFITNERTSFEAIGADGSVIDASPYLKYFEQRVFSALSVSEPMMGRGGAKQDADSMEEQVHDAVKFYQRTISIMIENYLFNEMLLEGGYNPIINEQDIVKFQFEEINLDTKVKMENHALTQFQGNAIPFEEMRNQLGLRADNVDESRLYDNMIKQPNALALINAKLTQSDSNTASANTGNSGPSKTKTTNGTAKNINQPANQHGSTSAHIKEMNISESSTADNIEHYRKNFGAVYKKYSTVRNDICERNAQADIVLPLSRDAIYSSLERYINAKASDGYDKAVHDAKRVPDVTKTLISGVLLNKTNRILTDMFKDIKKKLNKAETRADKTAVFDSVEYRLRFLSEQVASKAYWFAYVKTCSSLEIQKVYVNFGQSEDAKEHEQTIDTAHFSLDDIPAFNAYCSCRIELEREGEK